MIKIKFLPNWCSSEEGTRRLFDQFYIGQDLSNIEFVHDDNFDIIFYCGYERGETTPLAKKYLFSMEPCWSGNLQKNNPNIIVYGQNKNIFSTPENVREVPLYMFYGSGGEGWTYRDTQVEYNKTKNISCIVSNLQRTDFIPECLYNKRIKMVDALIQSSTRIDIFGRECDKLNCVGGLPRKIEGLKPYKFSIGVENSREKNYISEKFYDCILTNTIPIYYGATNIKDVFPENGYFVIEDIENTEEILQLLQYINDNAETLYQTMLPELKKIKDRFFNEFNLLSKIVELTKQI